MAQAKVTSFYALRKNTRSQNSKNLGLHFKNEDVKPKIQNLQELTEDSKYVENELESKEVIHKPLKTDKTTKEKLVQKTKRGEPKTKNVKRATKVTKQSSKKLIKAKQQELIQPKVTSFYESAHKSIEDEKYTSKNLDSELKASSEENSKVNDSTELFSKSGSDTVPTVDILTKESVSHDVLGNSASQTLENSVGSVVPVSPKRNLIYSDEDTTPKKRTLEEFKLSPFKRTPKKLVFEPSDEVSKSPQIVPNKEKSEELKKAISNFKNKLALIRNYQSNPFKPSSVISPAKEIKQYQVPTVPAYQRYSYLVDPNFPSSLTLPYNYKVLSETFRSLDTVVSILNNRKEKITFEKIQEGVQKMMKRNFSKSHFGQIITVMPTAYDVSLEKCSFKKANDPNYQLIISPIIRSDENGNKNITSSNIVTVTPQDLFHRKKQFDRNLLQLVFDHHQKFLNQLHCPTVSNQSLTRWHPKFSLDSVPDVGVATLPEIPENKINSAKDVLNKMVKGPMQNKEKVIKALKEVAEESSSNRKIEKKTTCPKSPPPTKGALKGVSPDLIAKIRARESAKFLKCMTQSPDEIQRKAMLERLPKIMQILWHYFIAERKAAVHMDTAIEKIIHSLNSLSSHEDIKAHLTLITEEFPGWLSFVEIPKGIYITMNKNKNLNEMLKNFNIK